VKRVTPFVPRQGAIWALVGLGFAGGCEFQEREAQGPGEPLPPARAVPPTSAPELGPVFAPAEEGPLVVGDEFWFGSGTVARELVGTFISRAAVGSVLDPTQPLAQTPERDWDLGDILVAVDFRGPGMRVIWRVVGPPEVVESYVTGLQAGVPDRSPLTSLGVLPLEVRHCCLEDPPGAP